MQVMDHIRVFEDRLEIELNPVALPGVASVHGWIMQKPGALQKDYLQEYLIEVPTARYFADTRIIKKKKKESIRISSEKSRFSPTRNWRNAWMLHFLPCAAAC